MLRCQTVTLRLLLRIPLRADFWQGGIWIIFRFDVWISLHADFWEGGILGAFLEFFFGSMFGYFYTLILGGGNSGRIFGVFSIRTDFGRRKYGCIFLDYFSIRCLGIFTH